MRNLILSVIAAVMVGSLLAPPVAASNNQGLYWGFSAGQRVDYVVSSLNIADNSTETIEKRYYVVVESLPEIQETIVTLRDLPTTPNCSTYCENGTETEDPAYLWLVLPVGNWSLLISLWLSEQSVTEDNIIDTSTLAGFNFTDVGKKSISTYLEIYQKSTGVLYNYVSTLNYTGPPHPHYSSVEISLIDSSSWPIVPVAVGGAAVAGAVVVVAIILRRRQH
ncbi:MAG: hypothetical protein C4K47_09385 [Candidatus Thorarchaeota archaeon]|nr:MAG: hypothetical protein C4K47_09385 [Candidatus Thorarchaeota archaeon]